MLAGSRAISLKKYPLQPLENPIKSERSRRKSIFHPSRSVEKYNRNFLALSLRKNLTSGEFCGIIGAGLEFTLRNLPKSLI